MRRILTLAAVFSLTLVSAAAAQESATTSGTAQIEERGGIEATGEVIFEDLMITPDIQLVTTTSASEASLSLIGDDAMVSLAIPETFEMSQVGGEEILTVFTAVNGDEVGVLGTHGLVSPGATLSVDVGGEISARPEDLAPGEYRGLLVVVAQYN